MNNLLDALAKLRDHQITGEQMTIIDQALSMANASNISSNDLINVIEYIDAELLHNRTEPNVEARLTALRAVLAARR